MGRKLPAKALMYIQMVGVALMGSIIFICNNSGYIPITIR